jgi:transposase
VNNFQPLPGDLAAAHAMILAERAARLEAEALVSGARLEIERLRLLLAKARREQYGRSSERGAKLVDQLELQLTELEETVAEDEAAAEAAKTGTVVAEHRRRRPARRPLPEHLPRERVVVPPPTACPCCGGTRLTKIGEVITETLDVVPRRWFVRQTVREKLACRDCAAITEPPAPFHVIPRGRIGASLLAMILFEKYGAHQPLNRQSERYAREGVGLDLSTMADHVGAAAAVLAPIHELIRRHVLAAERLHGGACPPARAAGPGGHHRAGSGQGQDDHRPARRGLRAPGPSDMEPALAAPAGPMSATTGPSARARPARRRRCSTIPATAAASIRSSTSPVMRGSCRRTPTAASPASTHRHAPAGP